MLKDDLEYSPETGLFRWKRIYNHRQKLGWFAGTATKQGYLYIQHAGVHYLAHRLAWLLGHGAEPIFQIDHIDNDRTNNKLSNLRDVTGSDNQCNRYGVKGVRLYKRTGRWSAQIVSGGKSNHLGYFDTEDEARHAYIAAKKVHHPSTPDQYFQSKGATA